jgi:hypothetical protein
VRSRLVTGISKSFFYGVLILLCFSFAPFSFSVYSMYLSPSHLLLPVFVSLLLLPSLIILQLFPLLLLLLFLLILLLRKASIPLQTSSSITYPSPLFSFLYPSALSAYSRPLNSTYPSSFLLILLLLLFS